MISKDSWRGSLLFYFILRQKSKMNEFSVCSLNVNKGMLSFDKLMAVKCFCKDNDVVLLQETRGYRKEVLWKKWLGRKGKFSFHNENSRGVAALVNEKFKVLDSRCDNNGRISSLLVQLKDIKLGLVSFYFPNANGSQMQQGAYLEVLREVERSILDLKKDAQYIIAAGDLNIILDAGLDAEKPDATTYPRLVEEVYEMLGNCGLTDSYRFLYPDERCHTFSPRGSNPYNVFRRLDYCFISEDLIPFLDNVRLEQCHFSDHKAVVANFRFKGKVSLRNFWRHNDQLLDIPEYVEFIERSIKEGTQKFCRETGDQELNDARAHWEYLKYHIAKESRSFSKKLSDEKHKATNSLKMKLAALEWDPISNKKELLETTNVLERLQSETERKIIFQSRVSYVEHNEKPTSFFMRKIKENYLESNVIELKKDGITLPKDKCNKEIYHFYKALYAGKSTTKPTGDLLKAIEGLPKLAPSEVERIKRPVTMAEITTTLHSKMNPGKSPGGDGLTVAFYRKFWSSLKVPYFNCLTASLTEGELTTSQKKSIIRLIQKKGKDPSILKNWRPISLMNCDAKIFSRLITARVEEVIVDLCSEEQLAYIKERNIAEGNRIIEFLIRYMEKERKEGYIVGFDFEKAFDSISHEFIRYVLDNYGFPNEFVHMFNVLYKGAESAVMNNGLTTTYFPLERSCRQGDCLSPYLFILALEPLIRMVKANKDIEGFSPFGHNVKISVYADDMTGFISKEKELKALISCINEFGYSSGLKLNVDKTEALHISDSPTTCFTDEGLAGIKFVRSIKVTGIVFGRGADSALTEKVNYEGALNKMRSNFNSWNQRDLTILGRVMLAKYHGISILQYLANNIEVPNWVILNAKRVIYRFVYKGVDKITRSMASKPVTQGGINLPMLDDVMAAAGIQWLRKARLYPGRLWAKFIHNDVKRLGGLGSMYALRSTKEDEKEGILAFNRYIMKCWQHLKNEEEINEETLLGQTIWKNRRFNYRYNKKVHLLHSSYLMSKGFTRVGDFIDMDGRIIEAEGAHMRGLPLQGKMEWALAIKHIKKYLHSHQINISSGFTKITEVHKDKNIAEHKIYLSQGAECTELDYLRQSTTLRLIAKRRKDSTPHAKRLKEKWNISNEELTEYYKNIAHQGFATKTRSFLFKLYAGLIYGNSRLFIFGFADSEKCERCEHLKQDMWHLLQECPYVQEFRQKIYTKISKNFSKQEEILGCSSKPLTYILLQMNRFIYQQKFLKSPLNMHDFIAMLKMEMKIEEEIATKNNRRHKHDKKWTPIITTKILD